MELDSRQKKYLKGLAHHLKPVVHVGKDGLTNSLLQQIGAALLQHELIKVKLGESSPLDRDAASAELPKKTGAALVQNVGRVFVLFREHPEEPIIELPPPRVSDEGEGVDGEEANAGDAGPMGLPSVRQRGAMSSAPAAPRPERNDAPPPRPKLTRPARPKARPRVKAERTPRKSSKRAVHKRGSGR